MKGFYFVIATLALLQHLSMAETLDLSSVIAAIKPLNNAGSGKSSSSTPNDVQNLVGTIYAKDNTGKSQTNVDNLVGSVLAKNIAPQNKAAKKDASTKPPKEAISQVSMEKFVASFLGKPKDKDKSSKPQTKPKDQDKSGKGTTTPEYLKGILGSFAGLARPMTPSSGSKLNGITAKQDNPKNLTVLPKALIDALKKYEAASTTSKNETTMIKALLNSRALKPGTLSPIVNLIKSLQQNLTLSKSTNSSMVSTLLKALNPGASAVNSALNSTNTSVLSTLLKALKPGVPTESQSNTTATSFASLVRTQVKLARVKALLNSQFSSGLLQRVKSGNPAAIRNLAHMLKPLLQLRNLQRRIHQKRLRFVVKTIYSTIWTTYTITKTSETMIATTITMQSKPTPIAAQAITPSVGEAVGSTPLSGAGTTTSSSRSTPTPLPKVLLDYGNTGNSDPNAANTTEGNMAVVQNGKSVSGASSAHVSQWKWLVVPVLVGFLYVF